MASRGEQRREARQTGGSEMTKFYYVLGAVAVLGVAIVAYSVGSKALGTAALEPVEVEGLDDMTQLIALAQGMTKGDEDAPITIVEFADYQCPSCAVFAQQIKPQIELQYVQSGKAKFIFYDFPLTGHNHAFVVARAARCAADQGKFWEYQDVVFRNQPRWASKPSVLGDLKDYAAEVGVASVDQFEQCLNSEEHAALVSANQRLGYELGVPGTPTILVSAGRGMARMLPSFDFASISSEVERLLEEAATDSAGGPGN